MKKSLHETIYYQHIEMNIMYKCYEMSLVGQCISFQDQNRLKLI